MLATPENLQKFEAERAQFEAKIAAELKEAQDRADFTKVLQGLEEIKTLPFGDVWAEFCQRNEVPVDGKWYPIVKEYEKDVLFKR